PHPRRPGGVMGIKLVKACRKWKHLPDRPYRLLMEMAATAKDSDSEPVFYGGRAALCDALGLEPGDSAYRMVRRALAELMAEGVIERRQSGKAGTRSRYCLLLTKEEDSGVPLGGAE